MTLHWYDHSLTAVTVSVSLGLSSRMSRRGRFRAWPIVTIFAAFIFLQTLVCGSMEELLATYGSLKNHRTLYSWWFYSYWAGTVTQAVLGLGVLYEAVRAIPLAKDTPRNLRLIASVAAVTVTVGCVVWATVDSTATYYMTGLALKLQRCSAAAWCAFGVSMVIVTVVLGLRWTSDARLIITGFLANTTVYALTSWAAVLDPHFNRRLTLVASLATCGLLLTWYFTLPSAIDAQAEESTEYLPYLLNSLDLTKLHNPRYETKPI